MISNQIKVAILFNRLGPYHHSRLEASGSKCRLTAIEMTSKDSTYAWDVIDGSQNFQRCTLFENNESANVKKLTRKILSALNQVTPDVLFVPGWSEHASLAACLWAIENNTPVVIMSDSQECDEPRIWWKESVKRRIVALCQAALVAGASHADYMSGLGMPAHQIYQGYDVIDNEYFKQNCWSVLHDREALRKQHHLPEHFFLASNRFVEKKNLPRLIQAFARYRELSSANDWQLVILGDGVLRPKLESLLKEYGVADKVLMPGFKQYPDLPMYYGLASAFIHASTIEQWGLVVNEAMACGLPVLVSNHCGCAPDLVQEGVNGFTFDPYDVDALAGLMVRIASDAVDRNAMGAASRETISRWTPETFATNLLRAAEAALVTPQRTFGMLDKLILKGLLLR